MISQMQRFLRRPNEQQRKSTAEKLMELGNLIFTGLVIGQIVSGEPLRPDITISGIVGICWAYALAYYLMGGEQ